MKAAGLVLSISLAALATWHPAAARAQGVETQTILSSIDVLQGFTMFRNQSIPQAMLADAQAVAIIPNVVKAGFVLAGRFGRGVVLVRNGDGTWRPPVFVTFTGGSVGWQVGLQSTDVVLVFKNRKGVEAMLSGSEFTLGADAAIAAGPVGRQASAGTDVKLNAEIYSYSRSRGLFAGVALDGSVLKTDNRANTAFYAAGAPVPEPALQLMDLLTRDTAALSTAVGGPLDAAAGAIPAGVQPPDEMRQSLADASRQLDGLVDASWRRYLELPPQVFTAGQAPSRADLAAAVARYDRIENDPAYRALAQRTEFRAAHDLLRSYLAVMTVPQAAQRSGISQLPAPPGTTSGPSLSRP